MLAAAGRRFWRSLSTWPSRADWRFALVVGLTAGALMAAIGLVGGVLRLTTPVAAGLPLRLVSVVFVPALAEEAVFRGLLTPDRSETSRPFVAIGVTSALFTAWHVVETLFMRRAVPIFVRADFLACAAILGLACGLIRWRTGSLWPCVILHWAVVVAWQTCLGGPDISALW